ncbi:iron complex transport system substrate-binding protein [Dehalogenimonas formicexedens]|uniref:Iron complex transport system substrate-binding protein n=2 Tax=Dehalogenimonas TaxID=670486 RepID=A0A1P8FA16_9CHLR|nr:MULTISPECIES: helical backbone metal receptor [Dehalogenimonas]APV45294.1 iron complex transport system substrate-binding protein [Dehalogenimonas formicexedens]KTB49099.1 ABC-type Fe3+-hydroxamate transport system, periplasmic component [Dehalogenimonas alkenigignens]
MNTVLNNQLVITDQAGRQMWLEVPKTRIVSLAPSSTEIVYALGAENNLYGVTDYCDYPLDARSKPKVSGFSTVDLDLIRESKPDLIIAAAIHLKGLLSDLERIGCPVIVLEANTIEEMIKAIRIIGWCVGKDQAAAGLEISIRSRLCFVSSKVARVKAKDRPRVFYLHESSTWKTFGAKTIGDTLTDIAGGYNVGRDFGDYYPYPTFTDVVKSDPDIIIAETGYLANPQEPLEIARKEPAIAGTKARQTGRIYGVSSDLISRPGPRMVEGIEKLAELFYPEIFNKTATFKGIPSG